MNKDRRDRLMDASGTLDEAVSQIYEVIDEEQEAFDNLSDGLKATARGASMEDAIILMEDVVAQICEVQSNIENIARPNKKNNT